MRALEVAISSGKSITTFRKGKKEIRPFDIMKIGLELPREQLYERINHRVDVMVQDGLIEEVQELLPQKHTNALQTVGYREFFDFFDRRNSREQAIAKVKTNTRHYAKRQLTWFKKDEEVHWFNADSNTLLQSISDLISRFSRSPAP
jgi:tRNA dimethylallyltransferase